MPIYIYYSLYTVKRWRPCMRKSFLVFPYSECIGRINVLPPLAHCCGHMGVIREENYLIFSESKHHAPNSQSPDTKHQAQYKTLSI
jgi:hypothetical protein